MSFPPLTITTGTAAQNELVNRAAVQLLAQPTGGLSQLDFIAAVVANMLVESPALAVSTAAIAANAVTEAKLATALAGTAAGLGMLRVARATFDPSAVSGDRTVAAHGLGVTIPDKAIICGGFYQVNTTFTSAGDSATIAIHAQGANDIVSAIAISNGGNPWDAGLKAVVPKANTPESTGIALTAARELTATVAVEALTAGKLTLFVYYLQGV